MKKIICVLFILIIGCLSCENKSHQTHLINTDTIVLDSINYNSCIFGISMKNEYEKTFSNYQFDSICKIDKLPSLNKWASSFVQDFETGKQIRQYLFIKSLSINETIYRAEIINNDSIKLSKRITK